LSSRGGWRGGAYEADLLVSLQDAVVKNPSGHTVQAAARGLSHFGEHSLGWLAIATAGAVVHRGDSDARTGRDAWIAMGAAAFTAHAASVVVKRIVRRKRPHDPRIVMGVGTPSSLSFPSSHATSTAAALVALSRISGSKAPLAGIPVMMASRLVLGVHYPTDVCAGVALGVATEQTVHRLAARCSGGGTSKENGR
jgi:membrane-associated phospholipid phosphatase